MIIFHSLDSVLVIKYVSLFTVLVNSMTQFNEVKVI